MGTASSRSIPTQIRHKHFRLDDAKLKRAQKVLRQRRRRKR